jgi:hypothetical protein
MLQLVYMDVANVDRDAAYVAYFLQAFSGHVASVFKKKCFIYFRRLLKQVFYVVVAYVSHTCGKCFVWTLQMFHTYVASVISGCCICFTHMLQKYVLNV